MSCMTCKYQRQPLSGPNCGHCTSSSSTVPGSGWTPKSLRLRHKVISTADQMLPVTEAGVTPKVSAPGGTKHDTGKPRMSLLPTGPLTAVAEVLTFGATKYSANNWRAGFDYSRLTDAALRHLLAFNEGEDADPESGISHIAHAICGLMFLLEQTRAGTGTDDRFKRP